MDREHARQEIRSRISCKDYLTKSKGGLYCCPYCGSGTGANGTGALKLYDTNTWTCHACKKSGDVIDLYQQQTGADYGTALSLLAENIGITIDPYRPPAANDFMTASQNRTERPQSDYSGAGRAEPTAADKSPQNGAETPTEDNIDNTAYYMECRERLTDPAAAAYLQSRGISLETAAAYWIGFDPAADPAKANHPCPRIIIPTTKAHYIGRRTDGIKDYAKLNSKGSTPGIFNAKALYAQDVQEVFVTEGAFDALSILEAGYTAIALNSTANADALIERLEQHRTAATLILCLDNDKSGKAATEKLKAGLQRLNIAHIAADICKGYKDPNEALTEDKEAFIDALEQAQRQTAAKPDNTQYYIDALMTGEIERFKDDKKTGFRNLDAQAGGLYAGLYVLAAISSLGKTSFALQLADQLAAGGNDVIFFSLEQSRLELVSKSIARRTAQNDREKAVTSLAIRKGYLPQQVLQAAKEYKDAVADRISIIEGNFSCNVSYIGEYVNRYIKRNQTRPVVFIDYLQILQPTEDTKRQTAKETIDNTVTELKRLSRELDLTIIVISSVNRANYLTPIDFESLKESGSIEFSCDVLWGLQLQCLNSDEFDKAGDKIKQKREIVKREKAATPRRIELSCLKNRYGISNYSCYFDYYPANDLFTEDTGKEFEEQEAGAWIGAATV
jgi:replicative DNA helicase